MPPRISVFLALLLLVPTGRLGAQSGQLSPDLKNAQSLFQAQKWADAVRAYEAIVKTDAGDPRPRAGLAAALYNLGEFAKALPVALDAHTMLQDPGVQLQYPGLPPGAVMLRIARIFNRLGQVDQAFEWLGRAVDYPIPNPPSLEAEPDMANLRADARWKKVADTLKANIDPCGSRPEFRQFDFWLGEWDVLGASGQKVGSSRVESILNRCVILETYTAVPGSSASPNYVGQAFHFFDANQNVRAQHYIDTTATPSDWIGEFKDGAMRYTREGPFGPSKARVKQRMTFSSQPDGKVRQLFEQSADDGKTWRAGFDGTYVRRAPRTDGQVRR